MHLAPAADDESDGGAGGDGGKTIDELCERRAHVAIAMLRERCCECIGMRPEDHGACAR